jgi:hypothetical protein
MTAMLRQHPSRTQACSAAFGIGIEPIGVSTLARRHTNKGDIA